MAKKKRVGRKPAIATMTDIGENRADDETVAADQVLQAGSKEKMERGTTDNIAGGSWITPKRIALRQIFLAAKDRFEQNLRHQSKVNWIKFSDENTSYFQAVMRKRRLENRITTFMEWDTIIDDFEEVVKHFVKHFENIIGSKSLASSLIDGACLKRVWDKLIMPKHRFLYWKIANTQLLTRDFLSQFMTISSTLCPVCEVFIANNSWLGEYQWPNSIEDMMERCRNRVKNFQSRITNAIVAATFVK
ncbi:hypothetical protein F8388_019764 [Cannabis sativa]|uniref:Reverse transcriptase zinc-binding domain-containing protein n=1 Tax=Cannabis sativa TaxID=3483 RepID=A0A7J6EVP3_CANSA|nr:hypothetical protein F8388_019764 [Cannabis sativa]